jgi:chemotaxis protein MotB
MAIKGLQWKVSLEDLTNKISLFRLKGLIMRFVKLTVLLAILFGTLFITGCADELQSMRIQNETQRKRIAELTSELQAKELQMDQLKRQLKQYQMQEDVEVDALKQKIAAMQEDIDKKKALIKSMQQRLLMGGMQLPVELSSQLEDFAKGKDLVTFDADRGLVKFKSDLLFEPGSADVTSGAKESINALSGIIKSDKATEFDLIIAGHTDNMPIGKPKTRAKHPTNWHLSAHRAISVLQLMKNYGVSPERMNIRGFGEYRPIAENKPNKGGNPQNRRVEIYIVPQGM